MPNLAAYKAFDNERTTFGVYLLNNGNAERLGVSAEKQQEPSSFFVGWSAIYYDYIDPEKRTASLIALTQQFHKEGRALLNSLREQLRHDTAVQLTAADRVALIIPERKPRHAILAAAIPPMHSVHKTVSGAVVFDTKNTLDPETTRRGMPKNQVGIALQIAVLDTVRPPTDADYLMHLTVTKMRFTVQFDIADRHKTAYLKSAWVTKRGLQSPTGDPLQFQII